MKNSKRALCMLLAISAACTSFAACARPDDGDTSHLTGNESVLKIGVFDGGVGHQWAKNLEVAFEKKYANVSFESGKTGVDVKINAQKEQLSPDQIKASISLGQRNNMEDIYYPSDYVGKAFIQNEYILNISDFLSEKVYLENGELADMTYNPVTKKNELNEGATAPTKSILDKMRSIEAEGYNFSSDTIGGKESGYYFFPYESSLSGFVYDHDLFEEQGWLRYGGVDGLPDTMDEFFELLDEIAGSGYIPFTFSANQAYYYTTGLRKAFIAQYEGYDAAALNYTYNGEYTFKKGALPDSVAGEYPENIKKNADGSYTATITPENAWILTYQPGKEEWIKFARKLMDTRYIDPDCSKTTMDFTGVQQQFVLSKLEKNGQKRIAMIYEGEWWENEARDYFNYTGGYGTRDFRFFPLPEIEGQKDPAVRSVAEYSDDVSGFVNAKTPVPELCRLWLQYSHSESALENFTMQTGLTMAYDFDLSEEQQGQMSKFARNVYKIKKQSDYGVTTFRETFNLNAHPFWSFCKSGGFGTEVYSMGYSASKFGSVDYSNKFLLKYFYDYPETSAEEYIDGMYNYYTKENWDAVYKKWIG